MKDSEPVRVLNSEECSVRLVAEDSEMVSVLTIEPCSTKAEAKASEAERLLGKLLISDPVPDNEPVNDLKSEA